MGDLEKLYVKWHRLNSMCFTAGSAAGSSRFTCRVTGRLRVAVNPGATISIQATGTSPLDAFSNLLENLNHLLTDSVFLASLEGGAEGKEIGG
jgi:hypothetical protein